MIIGCVKEIPEWEYRTAVVPETVRQFKKLGHTVYFEKGTGLKAGFTDNEYSTAGAEIFPKAADIYKKADILLKIWAPQPKEYKFLCKGLWIAADFESLKNPERTSVWQKHGINALALERLPRLSRVQDIDILSSQNNLAGYKAALTAMNMLNISVPLMMTAAGTLPPVKALVLGVGVAGLQAIATLQRMGAQVYASDIRPETADQITSLGAQFVTGTADNLQKLLPTCTILITSALSPNGKPPLLIKTEMLQKMSSGAIAIDLANGNIEGATDGKIITFDNLKLLSLPHLAADVATSASLLYARNMLHLLERWQTLCMDTEIWPQILINCTQED